ncbi:transglutaminase-like cysteine peptidase [Methylosinus sp. Ce-a6]|uniref:transglutaminase-like cysteine peptidase n=1 Tax=Methylosinus sp. Ce-a6 TaxID=2172005 RepID=UPI00135CA481|nr:transglutaminase-like cysteine peptidase [Methylosinus sp. Ce-a6]
MSKSFAFALLSIACASISLCADAAPLGFSRNLTSEYARIRLGEGAPVLAPFEHVRFCIKNPSECVADTSEMEQMELSDALIRTLTTINSEVNASIAPIYKAADYGPSGGWRIGPAAGDCNDYAVTKRHKLKEAGLPSRSLVLAVVKTARGEGHLVLVVKTTEGDFILDNLTSEIRFWREANYEWISRQSSENPRFWVHAKGSREPTAAQPDHRHGPAEAPAKLPFFVTWLGASA